MKYKLDIEKAKKVVAEIQANETEVLRHVTVHVILDYENQFEKQQGGVRIFDYGKWDNRNIAKFENYLHDRPITVRFHCITMPCFIEVPESVMEADFV